MEIDKLIQENNAKREQLNAENLKVYEEMLVYIRTKEIVKSERQTEEILMELLDHLLLAQAKGKTAVDVFGKDLKAYCDEIIKEIPRESKKTSFYFLLYFFSVFLATFMLTYSILSYILSYFDITESYYSFFIGKISIIILVGLITITFYIIFFLKWLEKNTFKETEHKIKEFFVVFFICAAISLPLVSSIVFLPTFGPMIHVPNMIIFVVGLLLLGCMFILKRTLHVIT